MHNWSLIKNNVGGYQFIFEKTWADQQDGKINTRVMFNYFEFDGELDIDVSIEHYSLKDGERIHISDAVIDYKELVLLEDRARAYYHQDMVQ